MLLIAISIIVISKHMSFLLSLFSRTYSLTPRQTVDKTMSLIRIESEQALPDNYYQLLFASTSKHYTQQQILSQVIHYLSQATTEAAIIKLYTIIMCAVRMLNYDETLCETLEQLQAITMNKQGKPQRLIQVYKSCKSYLIKLSSSSQLYRNSLAKKIDEAKQQSGNLYRMMNQYNLLFPSFNNNINSIGRYYKQTFVYYKQFYRVWQSETVLGYLTIKKSIDSILRNYRELHTQIVQCFLFSIPSIELLCDEMQNFMTNKYYKGKSPNKKIYFKEQLLKQVQYYLFMEREYKKDEELVKTAEDDFFCIQNK